MKSLFQYIVITSIVFSVVGCTWDYLTPEQALIEGSTNIRIENSSGFDFKNVYVNTSGGVNNYGDITNGEVTSYKTFNFAYRYAYMELLIDTTKYIAQVIDYVGEEKLSEGNFTYIVTATDTVYKNLYIQTVED